MIYIFIILLIIYLIYLYKNTSNDYFKKDKKELLQNKIKLVYPLLVNYGFGYFKNVEIIKIYDYFCENPTLYDGATVVKDITQIKDLDISAMIHDFRYIFAKNIKDRLRADWEYSQNMRKFDVPWTIAYSRMFLLFLINILGIYTIIKLLSKK